MAYYLPMPYLLPIDPFGKCSCNKCDKIYTAILSKIIFHGVDNVFTQHEYLIVLCNDEPIAYYDNENIS
jgi:hypothetical protein